MDGSLSGRFRRHPQWHIALPGAGAVHDINGTAMATAARDGNLPTADQALEPALVPPVVGCMDRPSVHRRTRGRGCSRCRRAPRSGRRLASLARQPLPGRVDAQAEGHPVHQVRMTVESRNDALRLGEGSRTILAGNGAGGADHPAQAGRDAPAPRRPAPCRGCSPATPPPEWRRFPSRRRRSPRSPPGNPPASRCGRETGW